MTHFLHTPKWHNQPTNDQRIVKVWRIRFSLFFTDIDITNSKLTPQLLLNFTEQEIPRLYEYYDLEIKKRNISEELRDIYEYNLSIISEYRTR